MIRLFLPTATSFSTNGEGVLSDALSCMITQELNGQYELAMRYPVGGMHYDGIGYRSIIVAPVDPLSADQAFRVYRITKPINGVVTVYARHIAYDLSGYIDTPFSAASLGLALQGLAGNAVPAGCPFTFDSDKAVNSDFSVTAPMNIWSLLGGTSGSILDTYGGEWEFNNYSCYLWNRRGADRGVTIRYGKNMLNYEQDQNCEAVYTAVFPYWHDTEGTTLVTLPEQIVAVEGTFDFTRILSLDLSDAFEEQPTEAQLRTRAQRYISSNNVGVPTVSWKVEFVRLEDSAEFPESLIETVALGDTVSVIFERYNVTASARVVAAEFNALPGVERFESITLGSVKSNLADTIVAQEKEISKKPSLTIVEQISNLLAEALLGANGGAVRLLDTNNDGYPDELYIADNPDPALALRVWRFNYMGWAASTNGYSGPFIMGATLENGFLSHAITAANLTAGTIQSADGQSFYLNLDENVLRMAALNTLESSLQGDISSALSEANGYTDEAITESISPLTELLNYLQVGDLGSGLYGVKIGKIDQASSFKSIFTATALEFYENNIRTAFLSNQKLNTNTIRTAAMELVESDNMGDPSAVDWLITLDNGFTIRYVG